MIVEELIFDRKEEDAARLASLIQKGWVNLSASEKSEYLNTPKGAYSHIDLNRVSEAQEYIAGLFNDLPDELSDLLDEAKEEVEGVLIFPLEYYPIDDYFPDDLKEVSYLPVVVSAVKKNWTESDIPNIDSSLDYYIANVRNIAKALPANVPSLPESLDKLTIFGANSIENALFVSFENLMAYSEQKKNTIGVEKENAKMFFRLLESQWWMTGEIYCGEF